MPGWRRPDPLKVILLLLLLAVGTIVVVVSTTDPVVEPAPAPVEPAPPTVEPAVAVAPDPALEEKLAKKPVSTKKGKLLKKELERRAAAAGKRGTGKGDRAEPSGTRVAAAGVDVILAGDATMRRAFANKLRGVHVVEGAERGFFLSLKNDTGASGGEGFAKCTAAVSALPQKKLLASLSARADVAGEGMSAQELKDEASAACAASLADDVSSWLRTHR